MSSSPYNGPVCLVRGSINIDEFYDVPQIVRPGQTISAISTSKRLGGKGANQAKAAACAGAVVLMDGAVGSGTEGREVIQELCAEVKGVKEPGVEVDAQGSQGRILEERIRVWDQGSTGKAIIQRARDGENSIIILAGANFSQASKQYSPLIPPATTHLLLANEIPFESTLEYLNAASSSKDRKVTSIYNPSPMPPAEQLKTFPWHQVDWLIVNEGELGDIAESVFNDDSAVELEKDVKDAVENLTKAAAKDTVDDEAAIKVAKALHVSLPRLVNTESKHTVNIICTLGAKGVLYVCSAAGNQSEPRVKRLRSAKLLRPIKDTTGAGDCFMGYLAAGLMRLQKEGTKEDDERAFDEVIKRCLTACSICVENEGAQDSYGTISQVEARLAANPIEEV